MKQAFDSEFLRQIVIGIKMEKKEDFIDHFRIHVTPYFMDRTNNYDYIELEEFISKNERLLLLFGVYRVAPEDKSSICLDLDADGYAATGVRFHRSTFPQYSFGIFPLFNLGLEIPNEKGMGSRISLLNKADSGYKFKKGMGQSILITIHWKGWDALGR
jgi:hypothetical protein